MESLFEKIAWDKLGGLIPAVTQDSSTKEVLMLGFMDKEALELSLKSGFMHYFSRSKGRIWKKGESSGHFQKIIKISLDCDNDSILALVEQSGVACHTGAKSCFFREISGVRSAECGNVESQNIKNTPCDSTFLDTSKIYSTIDILYHTLQERKNADSSTSYTAKLYKKGENTIGKKIVEEAAELAFAIKDKDESQIIYEAADLVYHYLVGLSFCNINPDKIYQELQKRFGLSGIVEKNSRSD
ncbi:MAG: bifunctional phosphoribosyl-AMP cyclohydrolase/phosphoribosyl-ATP diphosphatase HisIE [Helicobacteraceae bacterium]|nr:bifunctional phosphoribosyl-AMP cyclohydrolase/phosphoribosyl-ATP diphosphatase HisIE [Helicobacteraceae bacterium]